MRLNIGDEALVSCQDQLVQARLDLKAIRAVLAEANARAEHWAAQADRLAGQVEAMRTVMLEVADEMEGDRSINDFRLVAWPERLRRAVGAGEE